MPSEMQVLTDFPVPPGTARELGSYTLLAPLQRQLNRGSSFSSEGIIAVWKKEPLSESEMGNLRFIGEQITLSLENAFNYRGAQKMVFVDDLTGLYNMRYLDVSLDNEIKRATRFKKGLSLLFLDLDHFKEVNDIHGHLVGSQLLKETATVLKRCVREVDIAIRYGGDEFIAILTDTDPEGSRKVAERIRQKMEEHVFLSREGIATKITCCVGIANFPQDAGDKIGLIHLADKAMYRGKETTRNCVYAASEL
jgi:diguanylate cyclase (GGDEF)-like protein